MKNKVNYNRTGTDASSKAPKSWRINSKFSFKKDEECVTLAA